MSIPPSQNSIHCGGIHFFLKKGGNHRLLFIRKKKNYRHLFVHRVLCINDYYSDVFGLPRRRNVDKASDGGAATSSQSGVQT